MIGKKRLERQEGSKALVPLLVSLKLLIHVAPLLSVDSLRSLKISSRLAFLSTTYSSMDLNDESIIVTVMALVFDAVETSLSPFDGDSLVQLLEYFIGLTRDVIGSASSDEGKPSSQRAALASALVRLLSQRSRSSFDQSANSSSKPSALPPERAIDLLLHSLRDSTSTVEASFEELCGVGFSIGGIFQIMFTKNAIPHLQSIDHAVLLTEKSRVSADILVKLGQFLQRMDRSESEDRAASFSDYNHISRLAESYIQKIDFEDDMARRVTTATVLVVASVSLISFFAPLDFDSWDTDGNCEKRNDNPAQSRYFSLAEKYAVKATAALGEKSDAVTNWDLTESVIRTALDLYRFQLSQLRHEQGGTLKIDLETLGFVVEDVTDALSSTSRLGVISQHCLVRSLARLRGLFSLEGEELQAVQVARWSDDATQRDGTNANSWFEAIVLSLVVKDSMVPLEPIGDPEMAAVTAHSAEMESRACHLRLFAKCSKGVASIRFAKNRLEDLLSATKERISDCSNSSKSFLFLWLRTTILLGLSECTDKAGDLELALHLLRDCFKECRKLLSLLGKSKKTTKTTGCPFWSRVALSSLPVRCEERQVECLQKTALLYSRVGDYRKTMEYARLAMQTSQFETAEPLETQSAFPDLIQSSRSTPAQSCQEIRCRRLFLRLKAQASPLDMVAQALRGASDGLALSSVKFPRSRDQLTVNRELEVISDLYESKWSLYGYKTSSLPVGYLTLAVRFNSL